MTEHDIEMQERHNDASVYVTHAEEVFAKRTRNMRVAEVYKGYIDNLHEPQLQSLIGEALLEIGDLADLAKMIQQGPHMVTSVGLAVVACVQNYAKQLAERSVAREMGE